MTISSRTPRTPLPAPAVAIWRAQTRMEVRLTLRRGESVLLTFAIPMVILGFFSFVDVLPTGDGDPVDFLFPGVLALAVMSTAFVSTAIATGFERQLGVLKRLGASPLSRGQLLAAKTTSILMIETLQIVVMMAQALIIGFRFSGPNVLALVVALALATIAFAGLGLLMAGSLPALTTLAAANGVYLLMLLLSGIIFPLDKLPAGLEAFSRLLPSSALVEILHGSLGAGEVRATAWVVLTVWAIAAPLAARLTFRWE